MKNITKLFALAVVISVFSTSSFAVDPVTPVKNAIATGKIVDANSAIWKTDLVFGNIVAGGASTTYAVAADLAGTVTSTLLHNGTITAASYDLLGAPNGGISSITVPVVPVILSLNGTPDVLTDMPVTGFTSALSTGSLVLGNDGKAILYVGATVLVGSPQTKGTYTSPGFAVTVNFN